MSSLFDSIRATRDKRNDTSIGTKIANGDFANPRTNVVSDKPPPKSRFRTPAISPSFLEAPSSIRKPRF